MGCVVFQFDAGRQDTEVLGAVDCIRCCDAVRVRGCGVRRVSRVDASRVVVFSGCGVSLVVGVLRACRGRVIIVMIDPQPGLSCAFLLACGDCTNGWGREERRLCASAP